MTRLMPGHYVLTFTAPGGDTFVDMYVGGGWNNSGFWCDDDGVPEGMKVICGPLEELEGWPDIADKMKEYREKVSAHEAFVADLREWADSAPDDLEDGETWIGQILKKHGVIK